MGESNTKIKSSWDRFIFENKIDDTLNPMVKESWLRSKSWKIDPFRSYGTIKKLNIEVYDFLIDFAMPLMEGLYNLVKGSGYLVILCNETGQLLRVIGDPEPMKHAVEIGFIEGADWSEKTIGTNAIGTSIEINQPIQIFAEEHYTKICQSWTCSAAPIHDPKGNIIGVLNVSGPKENVHPHTLGMVVSAVKAIEYQIKLHDNTNHIIMMQTFLEAATNNMDECILMVNTEGKIILANDQFKRFFKMGNKQLTEKYVFDIFSNDLLISNAPNFISNDDIHIKLKDSPEVYHVILNKLPIYKNNIWIGSILIFKEMKKVKRLVNNLSGNRAKVNFHDIIGKSIIFREKINEAKLAARTNSTVLILGESGTGKDMVAQAIHNASSRYNKPFISINCGGIPRDLLGSELFGYEEGAFTGAKKGGSPGKFELADGGTLFLDEIGEMSLEMQVLLLRVLQEKEVVRIGGKKVIPVDVRIIAATNKNLRQEVKKGSFREDLFFRLNVMPILLPPLRERKEDIPLLVHYFVEKFSKHLNRLKPNIDSKFMERLIQYSWPGNIRELQNVLERTMNKSTHPYLTEADLPEEIFQWSISGDTLLPLYNLDELQRDSIITAIHTYNGNITKAAKSIGISRSTLYRKMKKYNITF
jgi:transcriptional regulator of acetoin/glycerol metabolism